MDAHRLIFGALACLCLGQNALAESGGSPGPACATVTAGVRLQAYGYAHVLTLLNQCKRAVSCEVWTDVDPNPHLQLRANAGQSAEIVSRYGSPAREFRAGHQCQFVD